MAFGKPVNKGGWTGCEGSSSGGGLGTDPGSAAGEAWGLREAFGLVGLET